MVPSFHSISPLTAGNYCTHLHGFFQATKQNNNDMAIQSLQIMNTTSDLFINKSSRRNYIFSLISFLSSYLLFFCLNMPNDEGTKSPLLKQASSSSSDSYQSIDNKQEINTRKEEVTYYFNDGEFSWTEEKEKEVLHILDKYLMIFILLMTFVLNMDRTNIC